MKELIFDEIAVIVGGNVQAETFNCVCTSVSTGAPGWKRNVATGVDCVTLCCQYQIPSAARWTYFASTYYASEVCAS